MSDSEEPKKVVARLLRENNVELKDFVKADLPRIAGEFWAKGLIAQGMVDKMSVAGVDKFQLAADLINACQPSLELNPEDNFPKFIAVLKNYENMIQLAENMESEFKQARACRNIAHLIYCAPFRCL